LFLDPKTNRWRHHAAGHYVFRRRWFCRSGGHWHDRFRFDNRLFDRRRWRWRNLGGRGCHFDGWFWRVRRRLFGNRRWRLFGDRLGFHRCRNGHRLHGLHETGRREHGGHRLGRLGCLLRERRLLALLNRRLREDVAGWQGDASLLGEPIHELARHDLFDRARRALHFDAVIALEQRRHFLAGGAEQFRDFVNPNS
jgi:hypothetical protein